MTYPNPQRVELDVTLESPGIVVLADVYYPGWELTIDDVPAPIYRINRLMRGAAAGTGHHHLVFRYAPRSFRLGLMVSAVGLGSLVLLCLACYRRPVEASLVPVLEDIDHDDDAGGVFAALLSLTRRADPESDDGPDATDRRGPAKEGQG